MSGELLDAASIADVLAVIRRHARAAFAAEARVLLRESGGGLVAADGAVRPADPDDAVARVAFQAWEAAGAGTANHPGARHLYLPLVGTHGRIGVLELRPDDPARFGDPAVRWLLQTFAAQVAPALERVLPAAKS
jgi:two-component system sensor histidine kinase KdpD